MPSLRFFRIPLVPQCKRCEAAPIVCILIVVCSLFLCTPCKFTNAYVLDDSVTNLMLCGDSLCKGVIAEAETLNRYPSRDRRILSFKQGEKVLIYAKPAYNQFKLVFAEINGRKGFVPFNLIREIKTTKRDLTPVALPRGISHIADEDKKAKTADENNNENRDNLIKGDSSSTAKDDINNSQKLAESRIGKGVPEDVQSLPNQDVQIDAKEQTKSETPVTDSQNKQTSDENKHIQKENSDTSTVDATNTQQNGNFSSGVTDIPTANSVNQDLEKMSKSEEETNSNNSANVEIETSTPSIVVNTSEVNDLRAENKGNEIESKTNDSKEESIQNSTQNSKEQEKEPTSASKETEEPSKEESIQNSTKNLKEQEKEPISAFKETEEPSKEESIQNSAKNSKEQEREPTSASKETEEPSKEESIQNSTKNLKEQEKELLSASKKTEETSTEINQTENETLKEGNDAIENKNILLPTTQTQMNQKENVKNMTEEIDDSSNVEKSSKEGTNTNQSFNYDNKSEHKENGTQRYERKVEENITSESSDNDVAKSPIEANTENIENIYKKSQLSVDQDAIKEPSIQPENINTTLNQSVDSNNETKTTDDFKVNRIEEKLIMPKFVDKTKTHLDESVQNNFEPRETLNVEVENLTEQTPDESLGENSREDVKESGNTSEIKNETTELVNGTLEDVDKSDQNEIDLESELKETSKESSVDTEFKQKINDSPFEDNNVETLKPDPFLEPITMSTIEKDTSDSQNIIFAIVPQEYVEILKLYISVIAEMLPEDVKLIFRRLLISSNVVVFTCICGTLWVTMYFINSLFSFFSKDHELRAELCDYQLKFFKLKNERDYLKKHLKLEEEKCFEFDEKLSEKEYKLMTLEKELDKVKKDRDELQEKVITLETDVTSATDAGLELNEMLSDFLTSQKENVNLNSKVELLQQQISKQEEFINQLRKSYRLMEEENAELKHLREKSSAELERLTHLLDESEASIRTFQANNESLKSSKSELLSQLKELEETKTELLGKVQALEQIKDEYEKKTLILENEISGLTSELEAKENEVKSLHDVIRDLRSDDSADNVDSLFDVAKIKIALNAVHKEKEILESKFENIVREQQTLQEKLKVLEESNAKCKENEEKAVKEKIEAQNNLEILQKYFAAKETELQQKVGALQVSQQQKEERANSIDNRLKLIQEENENYKSQLETMRRELNDSERSWKAQLALMEKKAHENWIAARTAEREVEELKAHTASLRQHLSLKSKSSVDTNSNVSDDEPLSMPSFMPPPPPNLNLFKLPFDEKGENKRWESGSNFTPPPPPPLPPFSDFNNMPPIPPHFAPMASHNQSFQHPMQWDSTSTRDAFSPISHQSQGRSSRGNSPHHSSFSGSGGFPNMSHSLQNFQPLNSPQSYVSSGPSFSNPASHWVRPNGNISNIAGNRQQNEKKKSRSDSRASASTGSLHASNV